MILGAIDKFENSMKIAKNLDEVFDVLREHIMRLGFECFTYELMWADNPQKRRPLFITSFPSGWIDHYIEKRYAGDDMICRYSAQLIRPFAWLEIKTRRLSTDRQEMIFNEASDFGLRSGGTVPMHGPGAAKAYLSVTNRMAEQEFIKLFHECRHELQLMGTYAHECILQFNIEKDVIPSVKLSPREIEILTWTARGKDRKDIAEILILSEDTVKSHILSACRKLQVSNKTHAAVVAVMHGLIAP